MVKRRLLLVAVCAINFSSFATSVAPQFLAHDVFFTPHGEVGLAGSYPNIGGVIRFLSINDQVTRDLTLHNRTVSCAAISSDGSVMASAGDVWTSPCELFLSNPSTGEIKTRLQGHVGCVMALAISPNAQILATGGGAAGGPDSPGELILWDLQTASIARRLTGHAGIIFDVAFSPDGQFLASASADRTIRIWNVKDGTNQTVLTGHRDRVTCLAYQSDGSRLVSGSGPWGEPGELRFWKTNTWQLERAIDCDSWVNTVAFAPDGSRVAFGGGHENLLGAIELTQNFRVIISRSSRHIVEEVHSLAFSKDGQMLAIGGQTQSPELRNTDFKPEARFSGSNRTFPMVTIADLWLPILISAVAVWFAATVAWLALPHHKGDFKQLPNEDAAMSAMRSLGIPPGVYFFPHMKDHDKAKTDPAAKEKFEKGPHGMLQIWPPDAFGKMGLKTVLIFILYIVVGVFVAYLGTLSGGLQRGSEFMKVFQFTGAAGVMAYCFGSLPMDICFGKPLRTVRANLADGVAFGLITGAIFAAMWPGGV